MENNSNIKRQAAQSANESFNCDKMRSLISDKTNSSFSERFRDWLKSYTRSAREKIWLDIESYKAG